MKHRSLVLLCGLAFASSSSAVHAVTLDWVRQFGTSSFDEGSGVAADGLGNVYLVGTTLGGLGGPLIGGTDAFVSKFDATGNMVWIRQFGRGGDDDARDVALDGSGNVYVTGRSSRGLPGTPEGSAGAYIQKYDMDGNVQWTRQHTNPDSFSYDVLVDGDQDIYIAGDVHTDSGGDALFAKYDADGNVLWMHQWRVGVFEHATSIASDNQGGIYLGGYSQQGFFNGKSDAFLRKYGVGGDLQWERRLRPSNDPEEDSIYSVAADSLGNIYFGGTASGVLADPEVNARHSFVGKYDATGTLQWIRRIGTGTGDTVDLSADGLGNVVVGRGFDILKGTNNDRDFSISKLSSDNSVVWTRVFGTDRSDQGFPSADGQGNIYVAGATYGILGDSAPAGSSDVFLLKLIDNGLPGDYNANGVVDAADYVAWRKGRATGAHTQNDYNTWRQNFGTTANGAAAVDYLSNISVPEPRTLVLAGFVILWLSKKSRCFS